MESAAVMNANAVSAVEQALATARGKTKHWTVFPTEAQLHVASVREHAEILAALGNPAATFSDEAMSKLTPFVTFSGMQLARKVLAAMV